MDSLFTQNQDFITPDNLEMSSDKVAEGNDKISELSKKGYQLLKENDTDGAREAFEAILAIEENNNYAPCTHTCS